jgi:hypothetical protein
MTPRDWFLVGLRLMAITLFVLLAFQFIGYAIAWTGDSPSPLDRWPIALLAVASVTVLLFLTAPVLARSVYPHAPPDYDTVFGEGEDPSPRAHVAPGHAFGVGRRILGLYVLYRCLTIVAELLERLTRGDTGDFLVVFSGRTAITAGVYAIFGTVLLLGPREIGRWIARKVRDLRPPPPAPDVGPGGAPGP